MVRGGLSDDRLIQLKVITGTLIAQKYQDEIPKSSVRSPLYLLDGQKWCSKMTLQNLTVLTSSKNTKINRTSLVFHGQACCWT